MKYLIILSVVAGAALLYLLSSSSVNTDVFSINYYGLLGLMGLLAAGLLGLVVYQVWRLRVKLKNKIFGAKLTLRLVLFFTLIAVLPGILVYAVSVNFLSKSIESWFDVRVEKALEGGLNLGRSGLDNSLKELTQKTQFIALLLTEKNPAQFKSTLDQLIDEGVAQEAALFGAGDKMIAFSASDSALLPDIPSDKLMRQVRDKGLYSAIEATPSRALSLRVLALVSVNSYSKASYVLQFNQLVPKQIAADAETVQAVYRDYQELTLSRLGLKRLYGITLTLALLVVLLTAISAAFFISERIGSSLEALAVGTRAVAQGDFSGQHPIRSSDELGALTGLFNQMTRQLADARRASEQQQREVESAKGYLESVLTHLSSGVLALDDEFRLRSVNTSAAQILSAPLQELQRMPLQQIADKYSLLNSFCQTITEAFAQNGEWQRQIERLSRNGTQILLMRGTSLPQGSDAGYVVVFDDISHLLQTERQAAWGEVARRLAHEIKNPLTPIQLSAERLQYKLSSKLDEADAKLLQRATQTIVSQVGAMKNMVTDFADYARGPVLKLSLLDVHKLIKEVLGLYEANAVPISLDLSEGRAEVNGDATRLRQVLHNLLQNAQDALSGVEQPKIILSSQIVQGEIHLRVLDNGTGFSENALSRVFEPYMTTKTKGTGLGLAIVKKIIEEHGGQIRVENNASGGACVNISLPLIQGVQI
ncbi:MAG TPA: PAS domain-containing sensor histidine kinase [Gallionella sp.]|nr:ATP-binding protein [Gallionella sp.]OGS68390.1 MAG: PAS domain-containing sensor histidine kinase [Gallionellales bacterium GWA2_54_124]OGT17599.1 MAG: PAS domain-containing sensor histidine kinase [Gallionellales bacterium RIFOXYD12_FULL_53_10]OGT26513.1 MAG: PAS domain-containing sensor histidine kinase [Gallionellales bacterium RIFOXYD2_FULL_52_7]HCI54107.1 PAS domain-containing sensor histidine kinase [Gallionella sp.]